jgi:hypothetical protein
VIAARATIGAALVAALALPAVSVAQSATPVVGGGSFNTAPLLAPGAYADTVAAGETVYWKVRIAKGQVLDATATVDTSQIESDPLKADYRRGLARLDYRLDLFTPLREQLSSEGGASYDSASARLEGDPDAGAVSGTAKGPRALGFEQILATDYTKAKFPAPGEWYVSLSAADTSFDPAELPAELPVALELRVDGAPQPSSADFARSLPGPEQRRSPGVTNAPALAAADEPADPALTIGLVGAISLVAGAALGALAIAVLGRGTSRRG